jgi:hypothetical protein
MRSLSEAEGHQAIGMLLGGAAVFDLSTMCNCIHNTVHELETRYRLAGDVHDRPRPGRPRATTQSDDCAMVLIHLRDRLRPATMNRTRVSRN